MYLVLRSVTLRSMYHTYIIASLSSGKWYYGSTKNLDERLKYYNNGWNRSTRGKGPWKYIFLRPFPTADQAREFEFYLKKLRRKDYILTKYNEYFLNDCLTPACPDEMQRQEH